MAKASNALILISSFKNKTPVKKAMGGIIKLSNDKNTGPLSSIILKNKIFAIAVPKTPWIIIAIIASCVKSILKNGS